MPSEPISVPRACVERLPLYYRALVDFADQGKSSVSSEELAQAAGVKAFQLRKDLSYFGEFGIRGFGYDIQNLKGQLMTILGIARPWRVCIVGAGRLGTALAEYPGFEQNGLIISAIFDSSPEVVGTLVGDRGLIVSDIAEMPVVIRQQDIKIGVLAVPAQAAQSVADQLVASGVKGIWSFAPVKLDVPNGIRLHYEDLSAGLLSLSHYVARDDGYRTTF